VVETGSRTLAALTRDSLHVRVDVSEVVSYAVSERVDGIKDSMIFHSSPVMPESMSASSIRGSFSSKE